MESAIHGPTVMQHLHRFVLADESLNAGTLNGKYCVLWFSAQLIHKEKKDWLLVERKITSTSTLYILLLNDDTECASFKTVGIFRLGVRYWT